MANTELIEVDQATGSTEDPSLPHKAGIDKSVLLIAGVVVLGMIMAILDATVVSVALRTWQVDFKSDLSTVAWTQTGYTLALATVIPLTGWTSDRFGTKRMYMISIILFVLGSALCGTAGNLQQLIFFRILQGLGGGMLQPLGMTILTKAAGPERIGRVMSILGIPMLLGPIAGPILGGWLVEYSWRYIFWINIPLGIITLIYAFFALKKDTDTEKTKLDLLGVLLLSPGLALFLFGISEKSTKSLSSPTVWLTTSIGIIMIILFCLNALRKSNKNPLLELRVLKDKNMSIALITFFILLTAFYGTMILLPQYFQIVKQYSTLKSGAMMFPFGLGAMITMPLSGALADKYGPGKFVIAGLAIITGGIVGLSTITLDSPSSYVLIYQFIIGLGQGLSMAPVTSSALRTLERKFISRGSTLVSINQQIGASVGAVIFSSVLTAASVTVIPHTTTKILDIPAMHTCMVLAAFIAILAIVPAIFLPRKGAEKSDTHEPIMLH